MAKESCIHPSCKCRAYKDPGHQKGTLLLFRLGCKQCGHPGSEHRKLTAVDTLVQDEVEKAAGIRCSHLIPLSEIPHSPVFRPHDPIPIPYDSSEHDQGSGVQCTCTGFQVPSLVRLWQSFRTYSISSTISELPKITCSTCQHTLQCHQLMETTLQHTDSKNNPETCISTPCGLSGGSWHPQLTLKASTKLAFTPLNGCVEVLPPKGKSGRVMVVCLHSTAVGELQIVVCSEQLAQDKSEPVHLEDGNTQSQTSASIDSKPPETDLEKQPDATEGGTEASVAEPPPAKRPRRRKRVNIIPRKSARLQKRQENNKQALASLLEEERERQIRAMEQARVEQEALCRCIVDYVSSVERRECYVHYSLPEDISRCSVERMAVATSSGVCLILALGTTTGSVFVVSVTEVGTVVWAALDTDTVKGTVKSLSWMVQSAEEQYLCAGYRGGVVAMWKIHLNMTNSQIKHSLVDRRQDTKADITMCSWAPDAKLLAAGSQMGEVLLYTRSQDEHCALSQIVGCGGSAVTCATWMHSSNVLAVGGTDDSIHILQRKESPPTCTHPQRAQSSLLSYFKPVDSNKYIHTHWLRGHCSFVSSLVSLSTESLLSLGWDSRVLFWNGIQPIKNTNKEVFPIEDGEPHCGFKLGPATTTQFLPLSMCEALGFGILVLLTDRTRDVHLTYYTFSPISIP